MPELASHHFGVADLVAQDCLLDDDIEPAVLVVQDAEAFQAGIGCLALSSGTPRKAMIADSSAAA